MSALTRSKKKGPDEVILACLKAYDDFDEHGWPDNWATWKIAEEDAKLELRRRSWVNTWK
jgi:hypothetical protein